MLLGSSLCATHPRWLAPPLFLGRLWFCYLSNFFWSCWGALEARSASSHRRRPLPEWFFSYWLLRGVPLESPSPINDTSEFPRMSVFVSYRSALVGDGGVVFDGCGCARAHSVPGRDSAFLGVHSVPPSKMFTFVFLKLTVTSVASQLQGCLGPKEGGWVAWGWRCPWHKTPFVAYINFITMMVQQKINTK